MSDFLFFLSFFFFFSKIGSPPKTPVSQAAAASAGPPPPPPPLPVGTEMGSMPPKSSPFAPRVPVYPPHSDNLQYFQDPRAHLSYETPQYPQAGEKQMQREAGSA